MFSSNPTFNQPLNNWNTSNVTNMQQMFYVATAFNQPLDNWNVSTVGNMNYMFRQAYSFNQNINTWRPNIIGKPVDFDLNTPVGFVNTPSKQPIWK